MPFHGIAGSDTMAGVWAMLMVITLFFIIGIWGFWWLAATFGGSPQGEAKGKVQEPPSDEEQHKKAA